MSTEPSAQELKERGNAAVKNGKFEEAVLHYTHAITLEPTNYVLYSNRSFAFLRMQHYHFALQDANETIRLNPDGAKGYFRKGEVEFAAYHFVEAVKSYEVALSYKPDDETLVDAINKAKQEKIKDNKANDQIPWLGAGIGIILGVTLLILEHLYISKPTHPLLMAVITISISMVGYGIAKAFRYYVVCQRASLLQAPPELWDTEEGPPEEESKNKTKPNVRFTKSQARQRYKKGKM